jgi:hypothetical protein
LNSKCHSNSKDRFLPAEKIDINNLERPVPLLEQELPTLPEHLCCMYFFDLRMLITPFVEHLADLSIRDKIPFISIAGYKVVS